MATLEYDAELYDWHWFGKSLWGKIQKDSKGRFPDGTPIKLSRISEDQRDKQVGDIIVTLNTKYLLK